MSIEIGSAAWHEERKLGIGGSDAAAALGMSKWKSPYALYMEKIGEVEPVAENWAMGRGKALEPLLRQHYADTTGREVRLPSAALVSEQHNFMRYNPDGLADGRLIEFKTSSRTDGWGDEGSDEIPQEYMLQVQHGMIVTRLPVADVTVSIAGNAPKYYIVEANKELAEMIIEGEAAFWDMVQRRVAPDPTTAADVASKFKFAKEGRVIATPEVEAAIGKLKGIKEDIKTLEAEQEIAEIYIKNFLAENDTLAHNAGAVLCTWKQAAGAARIDSKRLKAEQPDIATQYTNIGEPSRKFLIK